MFGQSDRIIEGERYVSASIIRRWIFAAAILLAVGAIAFAFIIQQAFSQAADQSDLELLVTKVIAVESNNTYTLCEKINEHIEGTKATTPLDCSQLIRIPEEVFGRAFEPDTNVPPRIPQS